MSAKDQALAYLRPITRYPKLAELLEGNKLGPTATGELITLVTTVIRMDELAAMKTEDLSGCLSKDRGIELERRVERIEQALHLRGIHP